MVIQQGDIYWIDLPQPSGSESDYLRPYVVIQNDVFNYSRIRTVVVCAGGPRAAGLHGRRRDLSGSAGVTVQLGEGPSNPCHMT